jgi:hypothetical protein
VGKPMTPSPNDLIQAFRLRFWRESQDNWRGKFFHEKLEISVANPEQAFELIRQTLQWAPKNAGANIGKSSASQEEEQDSTGVIEKSRPKLFGRLLTAWQKWRVKKL